MNEHRTIRIGVVGAGTMGAGIAEVALKSGYTVNLCDVQDEVLQRARTSIERHLVRLVEKGRMSSAQLSDAMSRLHWTTDMADLNGVSMAIEAVPENLNLKRKILQGLESVCSPDTIIASNTSSISITVLAAALLHRHRVIGFHFFNPAPLMKLIEIVLGEDTSETTREEAIRFARSFDKVTIVCQDTPGFIVNRVARNFYGEALRIVGEGTASYATVDRLMEHVAGFRMGPFRLMDLIGIDVNFAVTQSVYTAYQHEPRFRPHLLQERKVSSGQLGRKTGRGFYTYTPDGNIVPSANQDESITASTSDGAAEWAAPQCADTAQTGAPVVIGDTPLARALANRVASTYGVTDTALLFDGAPRPAYPEDAGVRLDQIHRHFQTIENPSAIIVSVAGDEEFHRRLLQQIEQVVPSETLILTSLAGPSVTRQATWLKSPLRLRGYSALPGKQEAGSNPTGEFGLLRGVEWARPMQAESGETRSGGLQEDIPSLQAINLLRTLGFAATQVRDGPGGVALRILAMILNEAAEVIYEGTASAEDIDLGMRLGTNYPVGPGEWIRELGTPSVWYTLQSLWTELGDTRYHISQGIQKQFYQGQGGSYNGDF